MRLVIIESPYAGNVELNTAYARACLRDSLSRGEAPIASHLLYTQVLDDGKHEQRAQGIAAGLAWRKAYVRVPGVVTMGDPSKGEREVPIVRATAGAAPVLPVFYLDLGISSGMRAAIEIYRAEEIECVGRFLFGDQEMLRWKFHEHLSGRL